MARPLDSWKPVAGENGTVELRDRLEIVELGGGGIFVDHCPAGSNRTARYGPVPDRETAEQLAADIAAMATDMRRRILDFPWLRLDDDL